MRSTLGVFSCDFESDFDFSGGKEGKGKSEGKLTVICFIIYHAFHMLSHAMVHRSTGRFYCSSTRRMVWTGGVSTRRMVWTGGVSTSAQRLLDG